MSFASVLTAILGIIAGIVAWRVAVLAVSRSVTHRTRYVCITVPVLAFGTVLIIWLYTSGVGNTEQMLSHHGLLGVSLTVVAVAFFVTGLGTALLAFAHARNDNSMLCRLSRRIDSAHWWARSGS